MSQDKQDTNTEVQDAQDDTPEVYIKQTTLLHSQLINVITSYLMSISNQPELKAELIAQNLNPCLIVEDAINQMHAQSIVNVLRKAVNKDVEIIIIRDAFQVLADRITEAKRHSDAEGVVQKPQQIH